MSPDHEFDGVKRCWLLLSPLVPAAEQYLAQFATFKRHLEACQSAKDLGSERIKPTAQRLQEIVNQYLNRRWAFESATTRAIDGLADFRPFWKKAVPGVSGITAVCHAVRQAAQELGRHPYLHQLKPLTPFEVAPLLTEDELSAIEIEIEQETEDLTRLAQISATGAAEEQAREADRLRQAAAACNTKIAKPGQAPGVPLTPVRCGPRSSHVPIAARKLAFFIRQNGLTQSRFAQRTGKKVSAKTIGKFLKTGVAIPSVLDEIAAAMGIAKEKLLGTE